MKRSETGINLQETRNSENETTETKQPKQAKPSKRRKRNDWNVVTRPKKKKKAVDDNKKIAIRLVSIVVYSCLTHGRIVLSIAMMWWFVLVVTVVSFSKLRWFRFGCYGGVVLVVSLVSVVSYRSFSFAVSCFSTCCLARLHFTSELNSHLYWT